MNEGMNKNKIQQLLKAVGSRPGTDDTTIECSDINWSEPHCFSKEQLVKLDTFSQSVAAALSEKFSAFCRSQFEAEITSVSQHCAFEFLTEAKEGEKKNYYLSFGAGTGKEFGIIAIPEQTAMMWAKQLLGDSESNESTGRILSQLEESLLYDLASVLVKSLSVVHAKIDSTPSNNIISGQFPIKFKETEEICRISFSVKKTGTETLSNASFLIPCSKLEIVTGKNKYSQTDSSSQDNSKTIIEHMGSTPVYITAQLGCSRFSFGEIMSLQADDIIMLDKSIDEPVELIVEGKTFGFGWPAKSENQYAITVAAIDY